MDTGENWSKPRFSGRQKLSYFEHIERIPSPFLEKHFIRGTVSSRAGRKRTTENIMVGWHYNLDWTDTEEAAAAEDWFMTQPTLGSKWLNNKKNMF